MIPSGEPFQTRASPELIRRERDLRQYIETKYGRRPMHERDLLKHAESLLEGAFGWRYSLPYYHDPIKRAAEIDAELRALGASDRDVCLALLVTGKRDDAARRLMREEAMRGYPRWSELPSTKASRRTK